MDAMGTVRPTDRAELIACIADAAASGHRLQLQGGGSKTLLGAPPASATVVDMRAFAGIIDYDPAELVLTVGAGTPLTEIEALVANENQMLAFEPCDAGPWFGAAAGSSTIGGVVAAGLAGSRRLSAGSVRDHLLQVDAISGRGERFVAGARVVKNVTGYDLPKLICGSWGRLAAVTQLTLKVLPRGRERSTRLVEGLSAAAALALMSRALGSQAAVAATAYLPANEFGQASQAAFRIEGFGPSVAARGRLLDELLRSAGVARSLSDAEADAWWAQLNSLPSLAGEGAMWRIHVPASRAAARIEGLPPRDARYVLDWAGGLIWLRCDERSLLPRELATRAGGHALLVAAPEAMRSRIPALHPPAPALAALEERVRRAFDPAGVFECGRFGQAMPGARGAD